MRQRLRLVAFLSIRDLLHERRLTICSAIGLAAVLTPLIVLFGLKNGVIEGLRSDLIDSPRARTITNTANRSFTSPFLKQLAGRPDVAFVAPRLRTLNNEARFERADRPGTVRRAELLASGPNDPLLGGLPVPGPAEVIATTSFAARLGLEDGMPLVMRVSRSKDKEVLSVPVVLKGIAPPSSFARDAVFVDMRLLLLVDDFIDGRLAADATVADVDADSDRTFAGFRIHARRLEDVLALDRYLRSEDVEVETHAAEISGLLGLDRSLTALFAILAGMGAMGYFVSLGVGLYANVERKQSELSLLRLLGVLRRSLVLLPVIQGTIIAACGAVAAMVVALVGSAMLNRLPMFEVSSSGHALCVIEAWHLAVAGSVSILGAALAAGFAGSRAAQVSPVEGLRDV